MAQFLTSNEATASNEHRFYVELSSKELELDSQEIPVPKDFKLIDLVVAEPTEQAIRAAIAATNWLKGYSIVSWWKPEDESPF